jgi:threonine dehydratase
VARTQLLGIAEIEQAAEILRGVANRTPVLTSRTLDELTGGSVFLKCENLQRAGSFEMDPLDGPGSS